ncbi:MAG: hypothetical protein DRJ38_04275 [Thermoprotei archaeon]|nr:MAG: hypothetical protein DRJ38_04275 [Thermoprotei archaeon]
MTMASSRLIWIDLDNLVLMEDNPNEMTPEEFQQLIEEMAIQGPEKTMPIEVCYSYDGRYFVGDGYHRVKAAEKLGWKKIRAVLYPELTPEDMKILSFKRNRTRGTLNPIKEGLLFLKEQENGLTIKKIAKKYNVTEDYVKKRIIVARNIPREVWSKIEGRLGVGYWYEIARLKDPRKQYWIAKKVINEGLSKREVKQLVDYLSLPTSVEIPDFTQEVLSHISSKKRKKIDKNHAAKVAIGRFTKEVEVEVVKEFFEKIVFPEVANVFLKNLRNILKSNIFLKHLEYYTIFRRKLLKSTIFYKQSNSLYKATISDKEVKIDMRISRNFRAVHYALKILDPQVQSFENVEWSYDNRWFKILVKNFDKLDYLQISVNALTKDELKLLEDKLLSIRNLVEKRIIKISSK